MKKKKDINKNKKKQKTQGKGEIRDEMKETLHFKTK